MQSFDFQASLISPLEILRKLGRFSLQKPLVLSQDGWAHEAKGGPLCRAADSLSDAW